MTSKQQQQELDRRQAQPTATDSPGAKTSRPDNAARPNSAQAQAKTGGDPLKRLNLFGRHLFCGFVAQQSSSVDGTTSSGNTTDAANNCGAARDAHNLDDHDDENAAEQQRQRQWPNSAAKKQQALKSKTTRKCADGVATSGGGSSLIISSGKKAALLMRGSKRSATSASGEHCCLSSLTGSSGSRRQSACSKSSPTTETTPAAKSSCDNERPLNHLIRMIVDKNSRLDGGKTSPSHEWYSPTVVQQDEQQTELEQHSNDLLILLGSSRCPQSSSVSVGTQSQQLGGASDEQQQRGLFFGGQQSSRKLSSGDNNNRSSCQQQNSQHLAQRTTPSQVGTSSSTLLFAQTTSGEKRPSGKSGGGGAGGSSSVKQQTDRQRGEQQNSNENGKQTERIDELIELMNQFHANKRALNSTETSGGGGERTTLNTAQQLKLSVISNGDYDYNDNDNETMAEHQLAAGGCEWPLNNAINNQQRQSFANFSRSSSLSYNDVYYLEDSWTTFVQLKSSSPLAACSESSVYSRLHLTKQTTPGEQQAASDNASTELERQQRANLKIQQDAIWELLTTEMFYIKRLKVIIDLFLATLANLQSHSFLLEIDAKQMSSNIGEVYEANRSFWTNHLQPMLAKARSTHSPLDPMLLRNAFVQIRSIFNPYYRYCLEHTSCLRYVKEQNKINEHFRVYVGWCESQKDCERLRLMDLLAKPMQRLTRYSLLLKAIVKRTDNEQHFMALEQMIAHMDKFVLTVDLELRRKDDLERILSAAERIDSYDIGADVYTDEIDRLVKNHYCKFDIMAPLFNCPFKCHRQLLYDSSTQQHRINQAGGCSGSGGGGSSNTTGTVGGTTTTNFGQLKFKDAQVSGKLDIVLLIFTDHLFICKQTGSRSSWHHHHHNNKAHQSLSNHHLPSRAPSASVVGGFLVDQQQVSNATTPTSATAGYLLNLAHLSPPVSQSLSLSQSQSPQKIRPRTGSQSNALQNCSPIVHHSTTIAQHPSTNLSPRAFSLILSPVGSVKSNKHYSQSESLAAAVAPNNLAKSNLVAGQQFLSSQLAVVGNQQQQHSVHSSTSSLAGSAARDHFVRSDDSGSRSADNSNCQDQSATTIIAGSGNPPPPPESHLRVIRSPYPIERLVMHELKDGQGVFCCQLNDSLTIASSFILYSSGTSNTSTSDSIRMFTSNSTAAAASAVGATSTAADNNTAQNNSSRSSSQYLKATTQEKISRSDSESMQFQWSPSGSRRSSDAANKKQRAHLVSPARQLINLIKQAQVRYQLGANFHGVNLVTFTMPPPPNEEQQQTQTTDGAAEQQPRSRFGAWSSFRRSRHSNKNNDKSKIVTSDPNRQQVSSANVSPVIKKGSIEGSGYSSATERQKSFQLERRSASSENQILGAGDHHLSAANKSPSNGFTAPGYNYSGHSKVTTKPSADPLLRAIIDQHQYMMLNHGQHDKLSTHEIKYHVLDRDYLHVVPVATSLSADFDQYQADHLNGNEITQATGEGCQGKLVSPGDNNVPTNNSEHGKQQVATAGGLCSRTGSQSSVFEESVLSAHGLDPAQDTATTTATTLKNTCLPGSMRNHSYQLLLSTSSCNEKSADITDHQQLLSPNRYNAHEFRIFANNNCGQSSAGSTSRAHTAGRRCFSRSARVSNNLEISSDNETNLVTIAHNSTPVTGGGDNSMKTASINNSVVSSTTNSSNSSTRSSSPFVVAKTGSGTDTNCGQIISPESPQSSSAGGHRPNTIDSGYSWRYSVHQRRQRRGSQQNEDNAYSEMAQDDSAGKSHHLNNQQSASTTTNNQIGPTNRSGLLGCGASNDDTSAASQLQARKSSLRRQNVILSASADQHPTQQHLDQQYKCIPKAPLDGAPLLEGDNLTAKYRRGSAWSKFTTATSQQSSADTIPATSAGVSTSEALGRRHHHYLVRHNYLTDQGGSSQSTTADQMSVTFDDDNLTTEPPGRATAAAAAAASVVWTCSSSSTVASGSAQDNTRAISFELGNLRKNRTGVESNANNTWAIPNRYNSGASTRDHNHYHDHHLSGPRSASVETRSPISVTLTLPNSDGGSNSSGGNGGDDGQSTDPGSLHPIDNAQEQSGSVVAPASELAVSSQRVYLSIPRKQQMRKIYNQSVVDHCLSGGRRMSLSPIDSSSNYSPRSTDTLCADCQSSAATSNSSLNSISSRATADELFGGQTGLRPNQLNLGNLGDKQADDDETSGGHVNQQQQPLLPVLNVTTASPQSMIETMRGFSATCSDQERSFPSSPDWGRDTVIRRTSSTTDAPDGSSFELETGNCGPNRSSLSQESVPRFLKRCQTLLFPGKQTPTPTATAIANNSGGSRKKQTRLRLFRSSWKKVDLDSSKSHDTISVPLPRHTCQEQVGTDHQVVEDDTCCIRHNKRPSSSSPCAHPLRVALSDGSSGEMLNDYEGALVDINCINNLVRSTCGAATWTGGSLDSKSGTKTSAYLGFHEKLELHNKLEEEKFLRAKGGGAGTDTNTVGMKQAKGDRNSLASTNGKFDQVNSTSRRHKSQVTFTKRPIGHSKSPPHWANRSCRALDLTRSMTGEIFDSFLRATSLRSISGDTAKANI